MRIKASRVAAVILSLCLLANGQGGTTTQLRRVTALPTSGNAWGVVMLTTGASGIYFCAKATACTQTSDWTFLGPPAPAVYVPTYNGIPSSSMVLVRASVPMVMTLPTNCQDATHFSYVMAEIAPTADSTIVIQKGTSSSGGAWSWTQVGTIILRAGKYNSATNDATCTLTTFAAGDAIRVLAPSSVDSTMANIGGAIYAQR